MYTLPLYQLTLVSCLYLPADESFFQKEVNFEHAIHLYTSRVKIEGCERCTLSPSIDGHWSCNSIFLMTKVNIKRMLILDMQFLFLLLGVKLKVVKDVHCPLLLMDTGLMSLSSCCRKLLQK